MSEVRIPRPFRTKALMEAIEAIDDTHRRLGESNRGGGSFSLEVHYDAAGIPRIAMLDRKISLDSETEIPLLSATEVTP